LNRLLGTLPWSWAGVSRTASTLVRGIKAYAVTSGARLTADVPTFGEMG
jgi:hypothetical protein